MRYWSWKLFSPPLNNFLLTGYVLQALNPPSRGFNKSPSFPILPKPDTPVCKVGPSPSAAHSEWVGALPSATPFHHTLSQGGTGSNVLGRSLQQGKGMETGRAASLASESLCKRTGRKMRSWCDEGTVDTTHSLLPPCFRFLEEMLGVHHSLLISSSQICSAHKLDSTSWLWPAASSGAELTSLSQPFLFLPALEGKRFDGSIPHVH